MSRVSLLQPPNLKKGDKVAIVAIAYAIDYSQIEAGVKILESWGLQVIVGKSIGEVDGIYAGNDELRAKDLQNVLDDKDIRAIIFARGGYGSVRIIDQLDFTKFMRAPKWICGYSDITVLHVHINNVLAVQTLHSTMLSKFTTCSEIGLDSLRKALFGESIQYEFSSSKYNKIGKTESIIQGGNLSLLYSLTGTSTTFSNSHRALFIEDIEEYLYHLDRMMMNMKRAGKIKNLDALLVGGFTDMKDNSPAYGKTYEEIILDYFKGEDIPICFDVPCGHIDDNRTIIFGKKCTIEVGVENVTVTF
jgi:muramoyltetrapeptide carboxypeptidase